MPKINLLKSETPIRISELRADYENDLLSALANTSARDFRNYLSFKLGEMSNEAKALQYTVAMVCSAKFIEALQKYVIVPEVEETAFQSFLEGINQLLARRDTGSFDMDRFWKSQLVQDYAERLLALVADQIDEKQHTRIRVYMRDYCPLFFKELLSSETTIYNKLLKFLASPLHLAQQERYYREKYYADLKHEYTSVTLNDPKGMTLDHVYQEPGFSVFNRCLTDRKRKEFKDIGNEERFISASRLKIKEGIHAFTLQWLQQAFSHQDFDHDQARVLLIYGYPGQGKTSYCKRLIYDLLEEEVLEQSIYMLRFRNIEKPETLKSEILNTVRDHLNERYQLALDKEDITSSILILDGLDELLMKNNLKTSDVDEIIKSLIYEIMLHPELQVIITSRHGYLNHKALKTSELVVLSLNEFDIELQRRWLSIYSEFHPESWLSLKKLEEINKEQNYLQELLGQPILLHMIAALEEDITDEVPNRAKVYELLFEQLTNPKKWKDRQIDVLNGLNSEDLRMALRQIAFNIFAQGQDYIHKSSFEKLDEVRRLKRKLEGRDGDFRDALKVMMVAFYFQEKHKDKKELDDEDNHDYAIEFLHKSLQEYLVAEYIWFTCQEEMLATKARGYFILEGDDQVLEFLQSIFVHQPLSKEIAQYLIEIIQNDSREKEKLDLAIRMENCIDYCLEKQFLSSYSAKEQTKVIDLSIRVFYGYLTIYSCLKSNCSLLNEAEVDRIYRFNFLLKILTSGTSSVQRIQLPEVYFPGADLRASNLQFANFSSANLKDSKIAGADLRKSKLVDTNFSGADLMGARLVGADLSGANLIGADLRGAKLSTANLSNANLSGANLSGANLTGANLSGANLCQAILTETNLMRTVLIGADLSKAKLFFTDLRSANLHDADLRDADFHGAEGVPEKWLKEVERIKEKVKADSVRLDLEDES